MSLQRIVWARPLAVLTMLVLGTGIVSAADIKNESTPTFAKAVDLFDAVEMGQVDVRFILANAAKANVLITNKTDQPIHVQLPDAFAAVPVLAQFGQQGFGQQQGGGGGAGGGNQGVGGGFDQGGQQGFGQGQMGMGQGLGMGQGRGQGNNGGFMRIAPEKTRKFKATTVCLEHGKPDPNPRVAYKMIPIKQFTRDARVAELCKRLGERKVAQKTAQAAAWHLANDMDWKALAKVNQLESKYLGTVPFFTAADLKKAQAFVKSISTETKHETYAQHR